VNEALLWLLALAIIALCWRYNATARETAIRVCRNACQSHQLQLLDDTVVMSHIRVTWNGLRPGLHRIYRFDVSIHGHDRLTGSISMTGHTVESIYLPDHDMPQ